MDAIPNLENAYLNGTAESGVQIYAYQAIRAIDTSRLPDPSILKKLLENPNRITKVEAAEALWKDYHNPEPLIDPLIAALAEGGVWTGMVFLIP